MSLKDDFERDGVVVVPRAVPDDALTQWQLGWAAFSTIERILKYNPVAVDGPFGPMLNDMPRHPALLDIVEQVFGPDISLYNYRFVVKDKHAREAVFLHQDTGYHVGWPNKASMFVALSPMDASNGGMVIYTGTHRYGYLGDAGEISEANLSGAQNVICPTLAPGDVILMHSAAWHSSFPHTSGLDRVLADIIYQPANDPSGIELLRGQWRCEPSSWLRNANLFVRSRSSRLKELQAQVDAT